MTEQNPQPPLIDVHFNVPMGNGQHMNLSVSKAYQLRDTLDIIIAQYEASQSTPKPKPKGPTAKLPKKR